MIELTMWFRTGKGISLERTAFKHPLLLTEQRTVRGKTSGALRNYQSFQWTPAVQALSLLFLRTVIGDQEALYLEGGHGTPAASLDYALGKEPAWLLDMFGVDSRGRALAKRLIKRTNPERKRPGPVILTLNECVLDPGGIHIFLDNSQVMEKFSLRRMINSLEEELIKRYEPAISAATRDTSSSLQTIIPPDTQGNAIRY